MIGHTSIAICVDRWATSTTKHSRARDLDGLVTRRWLRSRIVINTRSPVEKTNARVHHMNPHTSRNSRGSISLSLLVR